MLRKPFLTHLSRTAGLFCAMCKNSPENGTIALYTGKNRTWLLDNGCYIWYNFSKGSKITKYFQKCAQFDNIWKTDMLYYNQRIGKEVRRSLADYDRRYDLYIFVFSVGFMGRKQSPLPTLISTRCSKVRIVYIIFIICFAIPVKNSKLFKIGILHFCETVLY